MTPINPKKQQQVKAQISHSANNMCAKCMVTKFCAAIITGESHESNESMAELSKSTKPFSNYKLHLPSLYMPAIHDPPKPKMCTGCELRVYVFGSHIADHNLCAIKAFVSESIRAESIAFRPYTCATGFKLSKKLFRAAISTELFYNIQQCEQ